MTYWHTFILYILILPILSNDIYCNLPLIKSFLSYIEEDTPRYMYLIMLPDTINI